MNQGRCYCFGSLLAVNVTWRGHYYQSIDSHCVIQCSGIEHPSQECKHSAQHRVCTKQALPVNGTSLMHIAYTYISPVRPSIFFCVLVDQSILYANTYIYVCHYVYCKSTISIQCISFLLLWWGYKNMYAN